MKILMNTRKKLRSLMDNTSGNFAITTALCAMPLVVALGGSLDVLRITVAQSKLQYAVDSAALSAASISNNTDILAIANDYVNSNLPAKDVWDSVNVELGDHEVTASSRSIEIHASMDLPSIFLGMIGIDSTEITASSTASQKATKFEISMVLDISSSMNGNRLTKLKQASKDFVDQVLDDDTPVPLVSINLVPYGGTVNIGSLFDTYVTTNADSIVDPNQSQYNIGSDVEDGAFRFSDGLNCIEARDEDYNGDVLPVNSRAQVPHFYVWWQTNPWCPTDESKVLLNTNDSAALHAAIDGMTLSDGTGSDIGLLWGTKFLSPAWRNKIGGDFPARPADYDDENTTKIVVFMTDGGITWQGRPKKFVDGLAKAKNNSMQRTLNTGSYSNTSANNTAYGRLKKLCEDLETDGVKVFTIGFQIGATSSAAKQMEDCAVNGGNYYQVDSLDIIEAFDAISSSISNLRVTG